MKNLIIVGHPNVESFCYSGIFKTVKNSLSKNNEEMEVIDLYRDSFTRPRKKLINRYSFCGNGYNEFDMPLYAPTLKECAGFDPSSVDLKFKFDKGLFNE